MKKHPIKIAFSVVISLISICFTLGFALPSKFFLGAGGVFTSLCVLMVLLGMIWIEELDV